MNRSTELPAAVRNAFAGLIDYAGLFPPATLGMPEAFAEFRDAREGPEAWMLGRFIVPASRVGELARSASAQNGPVPVSVILDADREPRRWLQSVQSIVDDLAEFGTEKGQLRIEALEVPLPSLSTRRETYDASIGQFAMIAERAGLRALPVFVEIPRDDRWETLLPGTVDALARMRFGAKIRCGGVDPSAVPTVDVVALFLRAVAAEGVPFKATAGLHHPVRHFNERSGFVMHGFLNLLAAAVFASREDAPLDEILADERAASFGFDRQGFHWGEWTATATDVSRVRECGFVGYGSCSFAEPVDDLRGLGLLSDSAMEPR